MRTMRNGFLALAVVGGYYAWQNRFAIQRQLESIGIKTPFLRGNLGTEAKEVVSKVTGKLEHGARIADQSIHRKAS